MLELKNLNRTYKPKKGANVHALNNINLKFEDKGMVFILGKSGSGKSTLLNVIGGLDKYDDGDLIIKGKSTNTFKQSEFDSYRNTMIGFIFQEYNVLDDFTVAQNIALALELQGKKATNEKLNEILESVDLAGYGNRKPNELSGGQKQRVAIARALVKDPEIIMADEPTGALDSDTGRQVFETLKNLSSNKLVIVVSHDREFAEKYGSRIIEFKDGNIIRDVSRSNITNNDSTNESMVFANKEITIKEGYKLTVNDIKVINDYLESLKSDAIIKTTVNNNTVDAFTDTDFDKILTSSDEFRLIKSKLPFKSSLKIGASSLKHKTVRLVFSIILAAISFAMFGLTDTLGSYDKYTVATNSIIDSNVSYASFSKQSVEVFDNWTNKRHLKLTDEDIKYLNSIDDSLNFKPVLGVSDKYNRPSFKSNYYNEGNEAYDLIYNHDLSGFIEFSIDDINKYNSKIVAGILPVEENHIAIPLNLFNALKKYKLASPSGIFEINEYNDLIDKSVSIMGEVYVVKGIIDTAFNSDRFKDINYHEQTLGSMLLMNELDGLMENSHHNMIFISKKLAQKLENTTGFVDLYKYDLSIQYDNKNIFSIRKISENLENIYLFDDLKINELGKYDLVIPLSELSDENTHLLYQDRYKTRIFEYLDTIDSNYISEVLLKERYLDVKEKNEWNNDDRNYYYSEFLSVIDSSNNTEYLEYKLKNNEISNKIYQELFNVISLNDFSISGSKVNPARIVGFFIDENGSSWNQAYVTSDLFSEYIDTDDKYSSAISYLSNDSSIVRKLINTHYSDKKIVYSMNNEVLSTLGSVNNIIETMSKVFFWIGVVFAVFASLLMINFIGTSVSYKKQEIGILRAIGARSKDVIGIFFKEATIIGLINFILATIMTIIVVTLLNSTIRNEYGILITILNFGFRQIVLILAISLFVGYLASSIPVRKIAKKRPIDAIRDK